MTGEQGRHTFLSALTEGEVAALRAVSVRRHWPAGARLFSEGDRADRVLVVEDGHVKIVATSAVGVEAVLAIRGPGDILGELSAVDGGRRSAGAVATTPVVALAAPIDSFTDMLRSHPGAALALLALLAGRLRAADRTRVEFGAYDATGRVAHLLADIAADRGVDVDGGTEVRSLSQDDLAGLCGASREAVARALRTLREAGLVTTGRRRIVVRDAALLRRWGT